MEAAVRSPLRPTSGSVPRAGSRWRRPLRSPRAGACPGAAVGTRAGHPAGRRSRPPSRSRTPSEPRRRLAVAALGLRTILVVAGVAVALVVGSITAWSLIRPKGGWDSPEAAVRAFLAAAEKQDVVGLLDQVNPGEVKGFVTAYEAARGRTTDEDLVGGGDIAAAFGVDLTGLKFETHQEADNIAQVTLEGGLRPDLRPGEGAGPSVDDRQRRTPTSSPGRATSSRPTRTVRRCGASSGRSGGPRRTPSRRTPTTSRSTARSGPRSTRSAWTGAGTSRWCESAPTSSSTRAPATTCLGTASWTGLPWTARSSRSWARLPRTW